MTYRQMLAAYWLPSVGIGAATPPPPVLPGPQTVVVPVTDVLNYQRSDGSPQIDVINLMGCSFTMPDVFPDPWLDFDPALLALLTDGSVQRLQAAGIQVCLTITGAQYQSVGWSNIPANLIQPFVDYLNAEILGTYGLDGIDIDDEYSRSGGTTLAQTVRAMRETFPSAKIVSKALFSDEGVIPDIHEYLTFGGIMYYGDNAQWLEQSFNNYVSLGMTPDQLTIGVNAGPVGHGSSFTSIATARQLTVWQPTSGLKLGMMIWSFSQDIQQFTAWPQNQQSLAFPDPGDHSWQQAIIQAMENAQPAEE